MSCCVIVFLLLGIGIGRDALIVLLCPSKLVNFNLCAQATLRLNRTIYRFGIIVHLHTF